MAGGWATGTRSNMERVSPRLPLLGRVCPLSSPLEVEVLAARPHPHAHIRSVVSDSATPWTIALQAASVHGILQARILEQAAISSSRDFPDSDQTCVSCISCIGRRVLYHCTTWEAHCPHGSEPKAGPAPLQGWKTGSGERSPKTCKAMRNLRAIMPHKLNTGPTPSFYHNIFIKYKENRR